MRARDNPFATRYLHRINYRFLDDSRDAVFDRLAALNYRAAIVGPHGSGKTTLIEQLEPMLEEQGFRVRRLRLTMEQRRISVAGGRQVLARATARDIILFDGAEQLGLLRWNWFRHRAARAGGLIITSHRAGMLPTLLHCHTTPELLHQLADELGAGSCGSRRELTDSLFTKHGGNLRDCLRELYDLCANDALTH